MSAPLCLEKPPAAGGTFPRSPAPLKRGLCGAHGPCLRQRQGRKGAAAAPATRRFCAGLPPLRGGGRRARPLPFQGGRGRARRSRGRLFPKGPVMRTAPLPHAPLSRASRPSRAPHPSHAPRPSRAPRPSCARSKSPVSKKRSQAGWPETFEATERRKPKRACGPCPLFRSERFRPPVQRACRWNPCPH